MLARLLPFAEGTVLAIHILGWFAILISIIVMGSHHSNEEVWGLWMNESGYEPGVGFFVGLIGRWKGSSNHVVATWRVTNQDPHSTLALAVARTPIDLLQDQFLPSWAQVSVLE